MPELNYFDVILLPPAPVRDHSIQLSRKLAKYGSKFVLGKRHYIPHVSLYHIPVRPEEFDSFAGEVRIIAAASKAGDLKLREIEMPVLMTDNPAWLKKLHRDVVRRTYKYVDWDSDPESLWDTGYLPARLKARAKLNLKKYGSPLIGPVFRPHITLASFENKSIVDEIPVPSFEPMSFHVDSISICELGPSHSCQRVIATYSLNRH